MPDHLDNGFTEATGSPSRTKETGLDVTPEGEGRGERKRQENHREPAQNRQQSVREVKTRCEETCLA